MGFQSSLHNLGYESFISGILQLELRKNAFFIVRCGGGWCFAGSAALIGTYLTLFVISLRRNIRIRRDPVQWPLYKWCCHLYANSERKLIPVTYDKLWCKIMVSELWLQVWWNQTGLLLSQPMGIVQWPWCESENPNCKRQLFSHGDLSRNKFWFYPAVVSEKGIVVSSEYRPSKGTLFYIL